MKKYLKNLLVVAVALMPSLSINTFAQPSGNDPEFIPVKEHPSPNPTPGPRIMGFDPNDIPVNPKPNPNPNPNPNPGGERIMSNGYDDAPIVPWPGGNIPHPRIMSGDGNNTGEPIDLKTRPTRPRSVGEIPVCYHYEGVVYIEADASITYINASVTRYNDNQVWSKASNSNTLSITTSADIGSYCLELTLSNGQSYIGEYVIE